MNLGAGIAGKASATVFASPMRYTACLTENVEHTPWETLAVSRGYCAGRQRDHVRDGRKPAAALRRREHRAASGCCAASRTR